MAVGPFLGRGALPQRLVRHRSLSAGKRAIGEPLDLMRDGKNIRHSEHMVRVLAYYQTFQRLSALL